MADVFEAYVGALFRDAKRRGSVPQAEEWLRKVLSFEVFTDLRAVGEERCATSSRIGARASEGGKRKRLTNEVESQPPSSNKKTSTREGGMRSTWPEDEALS